jgi:hypothetical protein
MLVCVCYPLQPQPIERGSACPDSNSSEIESISGVGRDEPLKLPASCACPPLVELAVRNSRIGLHKVALTASVKLPEDRPFPRGAPAPSTPGAQLLRITPPQR